MCAEQLFLASTHSFNIKDWKIVDLKSIKPKSQFNSIDTDWIQFRGEFR